MIEERFPVWFFDHNLVLHVPGGVDKRSGMGRGRPGPERLGGCEIALCFEILAEFLELEEMHCVWMSRSECT